DIYETGDSLVIMADMPGVKEADLKVEIVSNQLTLDGVSADGEVAYFRKFQLPERIDTASGEAHLKDGVLTLRLSRAEEAKPKRIAVKTLH
ncbi:MAG: heat-shock protein, partial [Desulfuromonas sp.]